MMKMSLLLSREMAQQLRTLEDIAKNLDFSSTTHMVANNSQ